MSVNRFLSLTLTATMVTLFLSTASSGARADETETVGKQGYGWGLGLAVATQRSPYKGINQKSYVFPLINFENQYVRVLGNAFDVKLPSLGPVDFALRTRIGLGEGYKASDSSELDGMSDRKGSIDLGLAATWSTSYAKLKSEWLADVSGHSKGQQLKLGVERSFVWNSRFELTPGLGLTWQDKKYVDYYYGVTAAEATAARPEYLGKATVNAEASLRFGYMIDPRQRVFMELGATRRGSGITDSPIVDKATSPGVRVGYLYRF